MRTPAMVAKQIKEALKSCGKQSKVQSANYKIRVVADGSKEAKAIATKVYHQEPHAWLTVNVDGDWLPVPPLKASF